MTEPVGACVEMRVVSGIHGTVRELGEMKILMLLIIQINIRIYQYTKSENLQLKLLKRLKELEVF
jgi:hypothetical protein